MARTSGFAIQGLAAGLLLIGACASTDVTAIGPRRPARAPDCTVDVFPGSPPYEFTPVGTVRVSQCELGVRPTVIVGAAGGIVLAGQGCVSELRAAACAYGADTVFGVSERLSSVTMQNASFTGESSSSSTTTTVRATLAVRTGGAVAAPAR